MIVRPAADSELHACLSLEHDSVTDHVWQMKVREEKESIEVAFHSVRLPRRMPASYPRDLRQVVEGWEQGAMVLVAEVDGEIRGYVDLHARPWQRTCWAANMAVDSGFRRRGIATTLMRHANQWARSQGLNSMLVEATTKNHPAINLYQKLGYEFCGYNDRYFANQDIALFFVLMLR